MREIGAVEAKNKMGQLLEWVEAGEEVAITRHGKTVARLVPPRSMPSGEQAHGAAATIRSMSRGVRLDGLSIKKLVAKGRL